MIKRLIIYIFLFCLAISAQAENTRFVMSAPNAVEMGKQFRLSFTLNERGKNLKLPSGLSDNFDILMGPSTGQSTSISIVNGRTTRVVNYSYTYILRAKKEGNYEIRPGSVEVKRKVFESNSLKIRVVKSQSKPAQQQRGRNQTQGSAQNVDLGKDNMFVKVEMSKSNVFRGEQIIATVKLYVNPNIPI
ncbi:MAG: BatD family protein, partial [Draconibacterium sp.]|nr:BatD family protein [Draconibacterium sp.]